MSLQTLVLKRFNICTSLSLPTINSRFIHDALNRQISTVENATPPKKARVVICGGGVMGAAVAYHLAQMGWGPHTVLIEQGRVGGGSTWHTSGLVGEFKTSLAQVKLAQSSLQLLKDLDAQGLQTGWKQCGSLSVARTRDRMTLFRHMKAQSMYGRH